MGANTAWSDDRLAIAHQSRHPDRRAAEPQARADGCDVSGARRRDTDARVRTAPALSGREQRRGHGGCAAAPPPRRSGARPRALPPCRAHPSPPFPHADRLGPFVAVEDKTDAADAADADPDAALQGEFSWTIEGVTKLKQQKLYSPVFQSGQYNWRILLFPGGNNVQQLSVYLDVADSGQLPQGWTRQAHFSLTVHNQKVPPSSGCSQPPTYFARPTGLAPRGDVYRRAVKRELGLFPTPRVLARTP